MWPESDGMATVSAYLPAAEAVGVFAVLDDHARRAGSAGDDRSMDARRADALVDLVLNPTGFASAATTAARDHTTTASTPAAGCRRIAAISTTASHMIQTRSFADTGIGPRSQTPLQPQRGYQTVARGDWAVRKYARPLIYPPMPLVCCIRVCQKGPTQAAAIRVRALDVR